MDERIVKYFIAKSLCIYIYKLISLCNWIRFKIRFTHRCTQFTNYECWTLAGFYRLLSLNHLPFYVLYRIICYISYFVFLLEENSCNLWKIDISFFSFFWDVNRFTSEISDDEKHSFVVLNWSWVNEKNNVLMPFPRQRICNAWHRENDVSMSHRII